MFIGERDVTPLFTQSTAATLHGTRGLRLMVHQTVLWTDQLTVTAADDGSTARCVATVSGLGANTTYIRITVHCKSLLAAQHSEARHLLSECLSVSLSVRHSHESCLNSTRY